jgi:hypothetical protein
LDGGKLSSVLVSNVLNEEKKQQAIALGPLGWSLRQIQKAIGVRRETISVYLRAGVAMRAPRSQYIPAKPASHEERVITDPTEAKPASLDEVITDSGVEFVTTSEAKPDSQPGRSPCERSSSHRSRPTPNTISRCTCTVSEMCSTRITGGESAGIH